MPKFRVIQYFTSSKTYLVDAETAEEACNIVNGTEASEPSEESGPDFSDERVEVDNG